MLCVDTGAICGAECISQSEDDMKRNKEAGNSPCHHFHFRKSNTLQENFYFLRGHSFSTYKMDDLLVLTKVRSELKGPKTS